MPRKKTPSVLLIEDDAFLAGIYTRAFTAAGCKTSVADTAAAAFSHLQKKRPDVILFERLRAETDGFGLIAQIKADAVGRSVPVVVLTSLGTREDVQHALDAGAVDYLHKAHVRPVEVVSRVLSFIK